MPAAPGLEGVPPAPSGGASTQGQGPVGGAGAYGGDANRPRTVSMILDQLARGLIVGGLVGLVVSTLGLLLVGRIRRRY